MKIGDKVTLKSGVEGTVKREAWGNRVVIEAIGNLSGEPREIVVPKSSVKKEVSMLARSCYLLGWLVLLLLGAILVLAWLYPQQIMTGVPRPALVALALLLIGAIIVSLVAAARKR